MNPQSVVSLPILVRGAMTCVIQLWADIGEADPPTWSLIRQIGAQLSLVAERELVAQELAEARDEAMAASRHKSDFLAMMSHEIRTPMNGVIGLGDLLLTTDLDRSQRRLTESLRGAGLTLLSLLNDILDLSKIESGRLELETIGFDLRSVLDQTTAVLVGPAREKRVELVVSCDPSVPRHLLGDPVRLGQIITNLGSNAVKFTDVGEVVVDCSATVHPEDHPGAPAGRSVELRVEVRDTGIGIAPAVVESLFDAFTQADRSTTRRHGGTGLGLAIVRQLAEEMDGAAEVDSSPGAGSIFTVTVWLGLGTDQPTLPSTRTLHHRRALIVDDNAQAAEHIARELRAWQVEPVTVSDPRVALDLLEDAAEGPTPFDIALVDNDLSGATSDDLGELAEGLTLARRIRELPGLRDLPLVLLSDNPTVDGDEVGAAGFVAWAVKPVRSSELLDAILDGLQRDVATPVFGSDRRPRVTRPPVDRLGLHVLIAEDNRVNQVVATGMVEALGCRVDIVADGRAAVAALRPGHSYDLVLMDCRMPHLDGYDATRAVRRAEFTADAPRVPIIAVTASALAGERDRCLTAGMDDFLSKPIDAAQVAHALVRWGRQDQRKASAPAQAPDPGDPPEPRVLDPERVAMLGELVKDGIDFFERTRMSFLARIDPTLKELRVATEADDADRVQAVAHQLKGSSLNLGLQRLGGTAEAIEAYAAGGSVDGIEALLTRLTDEAHVGVEALINARSPR